MSLKRIFKKISNKFFYTNIFVDKWKLFTITVLTWVFIMMVTIQSTEKSSYEYKDPSEEPLLSILTSPKYGSYPSNQLTKYTIPMQEPMKRRLPGDNGEPVKIPTHLSAKVEKQFGQHQLNMVASSLMPEDRILPDFRSNHCKTQNLPEYLPQVSVIIVFHNEPLSTLMRTIASVINRSSKELLKEIVVVDDFSSLENLGEEFEEKLKVLDVSTKILRLKERNGLIRARLHGARKASGSVLVFFDAHVEVTRGWLEPLLEIITLNRTTVAVPVIDTIDKNTFHYERSEDDRTRSGFDTSLYHAWVGSEPVHQGKHYSEPFPSPTMVGCAFAVDREFFFEVGGYDEGMVIWGGENIEQSIRVSFIICINKYVAKLSLNFYLN